MNCDEANVMMHALMDGELDAGHAREVESHVAGCDPCARELREVQELRRSLNPAALRFTAPAALRPAPGPPRLRPQACC